MWVLYPVVIALMVIAAELGHIIGWRTRRRNPDHADLGTLTGATLGLLALLLAFGFSIALSRYEARRTMVLEEANAIGSTANFALMLPAPAQQPILSLLRDYTVVRAGFGIPFDPPKFSGTSPGRWISRPGFGSRRSPSPLRTRSRCPCIASSRR